MGLIRKALFITTPGLVSPYSKKQSAAKRRQAAQGAEQAPAGTGQTALRSRTAGQKKGRRQCGSS